MKGDFSRIRFNRRKHYTSVLQQQGRVALDADTNEQCAINEHLRGTETKDVVGLYGGPSGYEGFAITVSGNQILIGPGRYYVHGILCENEQDSLAYTEQPFLINPSPTDADLLEQLQAGTITTIQVYLEVWQRLVTALDDPCLREPALGQADTTARVQTVWRVVAQGIAAVQPASSTGSVQAFESSVLKETVRQPGLGMTTGAPVVSPSSGSRPPIFPLPPILFPQPQPIPGQGQTPGDCCADMYQPTAQEGPPGRLSARTNDTSDPCSCEPTPPAGYRGLENQLYRIEIHQSGDETSATFKWSRENGSVVVVVTGVSGRQVYVDSLGPDANLGFSVGQWVEIMDDSYLFGQLPNQPGNLYQIQSITPEQLTMTMTEVVAVDLTKNPRLRRWDQFGAAAGSGGVALSVGSWLDLENGIQVQFASGQYQSGDYWLIPARTASGQIDWPPCDSDGNPFQPAHHVKVFQAPLACIQWDSRSGQATRHDCRRPFSPLTALTPAAAPPALHVTNISWSNDDVMTLDQLVANGLTVTLDQAPPQQQYITAGNFVVSLEVAIPIGTAQGETFFAAMPLARATTASLATNPSDTQRLQDIAAKSFRFLPTSIVRAEVILDSEIKVGDQQISWLLLFEPDNVRQQRTLAYIDLLLLGGAQISEFGRMRVKLVGRTLFSTDSSGKQIFLDGQSFGVAGVRADGTTPRVDLQLPSGNEEKASNFESWFYLIPTLTVTTLSIDHPNAQYNQDGTVTDVGGKVPVSPQGTVTLNYPPLVDTPVTLSLSGSNSATGIFSIPSTVNVSAGVLSVSFAITVQGNTGSPTAETWIIIASLTSALGITYSAQAQFSVTGFEVIQ